MQISFDEGDRNSVILTGVLEAIKLFGTYPNTMVTYARDLCNNVIIKFIISWIHPPPAVFAMSHDYHDFSVLV